MTLKELKKKLESGTIEASLSGVELKRQWQQEHGKKISAIANSEVIPVGWIVIGIDDDGKLCGYDKKWLRKTEQSASNQIHQYLQPSWSIGNIVGCTIQNSQCLFIEIFNSQDVVTWNGAAYKLVGTTAQKMREDEVLELSLRLPGIDFSKSCYEGEYDSSLITSFAQKISNISSEFVTTHPLIPLIFKEEEFLLLGRGRWPEGRSTPCSSWF